MAEGVDEFALISAVAEKDDFGLEVGAAQLGQHGVVEASWSLVAVQRWILATHSPRSRQRTEAGL